ncbi:MAG: Transcriptional regulatory protein LiaR [Planctomycetota bacterium]
MDEMPVIKAVDSRGSQDRARKKVIHPLTGTSVTRIRLICVDDHALLLEGIKVQISLDPEIEFVAGLPTANDLLNEVARLSPDVITLDVEMPGLDIFEVVNQMRAKFPKVRFALLTAHVRESLLAAAYRANASGYFAKGDDLSEIVAGIKRVARSTAGTFVMTSRVQAQCAAQGMPRRNGKSRRVSTVSVVPGTLIDRLTAREIEVLRMIGSGRSRVEIAQLLSRSPKTIDGHQERIMKKLGIDSRASLIRFAIREGVAQA